MQKYAVAKLGQIDVALLHVEDIKYNYLREYFQNGQSGCGEKIN